MNISIATQQDKLELLGMIADLRKEVQALKAAQGGLSTDFTLRQAADKLGLSEQTVRKYANLYKENPEARKALAYYKAGSLYRFTPDSIQDWKERNSFNHQAA